MAAVRGWAPGSFDFDCNNELGTCLLRRQKIALNGIALLCTGGMAWCVWSAVTALRRAQIRRAHVAAAMIGAVLALVVFIIDPVGHLDNSHTGWLAGALVLIAPPYGR